jgi:hypothetical protein
VSRGGGEAASTEYQQVFLLPSIKNRSPLRFILNYTCDKVGSHLLGANKLAITICINELHVTVYHIVLTRIAVPFLVFYHRPMSTVERPEKENKNYLMRKQVITFEILM